MLNRKRKNKLIKLLNSYSNDNDILRDTEAEIKKDRTRAKISRNKAHQLASKAHSFIKLTYHLTVL